VPVGGAADRFSLSVANLLLGNAIEAPAVEVTLSGFEAEAIDETLVALAGADLGAGLHPGGSRLAVNGVHHVPVGSRLRFDGPPGAGLRAYIAMAGGIRAPRILGSAATLAVGGLGGLHGDGRPIRAGDVLAGAMEDGPRAVPISSTIVVWPFVAWPSARPVRVLPGPHAGTRRSVLRALVGSRWQVDAASDRMGLRLAGERLASDPSEPEEPASFPLARGAIQVPPSGEPIVLLSDHQTIGGYPVPAVVIRADLDRLGQLRPGDEIEFELVTELDAREAARERGERLALLQRVLLEQDPWAELADAAGG
jgi:biotin-dependent carboxylase-like uncharacterized protein